MKVIKDFRINDIKAHEILFAITSPDGYEMERLILLEIGNMGEYILLEGYHCSCYEFDIADWEATAYSEEELAKLIQAEKSDPLRIRLRQFLEYYKNG